MGDSMTEKEDWLDSYRSYPDTQPDGFATFHTSRVAPIAYEIPLGSKVLDVGANSGEFMKLLKEKRECEVYGIDVSEIAIAKAKEKGFEVINCDAARMPFEDASFDVVVLMEVLSHLVDPEAVLKEVRRVLKPGGFLLGSVPHANLERYIWEEGRKHREYYDEPGLRDLLEKEFPFTYVRTLTGAQFAVAMASSFMKDKPAEMLFKCGGTQTGDWESSLNEHVNFPDIMPHGIENYPAIKSRIDPIYYEIKEGSKVLDVGCNSGEFMRLLRDQKDCDVSGIDISVPMVELCKSRGLDVSLAGADKLPFPDATFDVVTLMEVLEHFEDPQPALKEMRRVLKPEGILLGSCPHGNFERYHRDDERPHHQFYSDDGLKKDLEQVFDKAFLKVLTGAQSTIRLLDSHLADEPCQFLFKAGGSECQPWDEHMRKESKMRVWFGPTQLAGTVYYRMLGFAEKMDKLGLIQAGYEHAPWNQIDNRTKEWQQRIRSKVVLHQLEGILKVAHASVWQIVLSRDVLAFLRCAKDLANGPWYKATGERKAFITEIDDNLFDIPSGNVATNPYQPNSEAEWVAQKQIELSDALVCSTQFLLDKIKAMYPDKPAYLVPNSLDFDIWDNVKFEDGGLPKKEDGIIRIGYTGCSNHRKDLEMIREPMSAILKEFPNVQFLMTPQPEPGGFFTGWPGVPNMGFVAKWVLIDEYPKFLRSWDLDIGVAPLQDNDFNRAKSNLRWLEYSALHLPTVASRVYPFKNSIRHGEDGFVCNTSQQWYDALKSLILDAQKRKAIGEAAYRRVKADFNLETTSRRYAEILTEIQCNVPIWKQRSAASSGTLPLPGGQLPLLTAV